MVCVCVSVWRKVRGEPCFQSISTLVFLTLLQTFCAIFFSNHSDTVRLECEKYSFPLKCVSNFCSESFAMITVRCEPSSHLSHLCSFNFLQSNMRSGVSPMRGYMHNILKYNVISH